MGTIEESPRRDGEKPELTEMAVTLLATALQLCRCVFSKTFGMATCGSYR